MCIRDRSYIRYTISVISGRIQLEHVDSVTQDGTYDAREQKRSLKYVLPQSHQWPFHEIATESGWNRRRTAGKRSVRNDVRKRHSEGSETVAPGELLEFLAQTGVAIGGQDEEKSTLTAIKLHWSARCAGGRSRH